MLTFEYENLADTYSSAEEIVRALHDTPDGFVFQVLIHSASHYSDLAYSFLEAAYIGKLLSEHAERADCIIDWTTKEPTVKLFFNPTNILPLSDLIFYLGQVATGDDEDIYVAFIGELSEYQDKVHEEDQPFPELLDDYLANYVNGEYYEYDPVEAREFFDKEHSNYPERKYGFHKSALSKKTGYTFYTSPDSIITPNTSNLNVVLKVFAGIENLTWLKADFFAIGNISYLVSNGFIVHFPFDNFIKAKNCAGEALDRYDPNRYREAAGWMNGFLSFNRERSTHNEKENLKGYPQDLSEELLAGAADDRLPDPEVVCFYISAYGEQLCVKDARYTYFFFGVDKLTAKELQFLGSRLSLLFQTAANLAGIHVDIKCPWEKLNEETFEELCFDIIYYNPTFNNETIRKMGKTRSRDGGRDIEVYTHGRPGKPACKYIFQCKYLTPGSSLTSSKVQSISDTVTQYGASGYGLMTNVVIDAALYDKLDGIARTLNIEIEDYSVYKLERILAAYPQIKERHFTE